MADIVLDITKKGDFNRKFYFDLLVAIRYPNGRPSNLTHITGVGTPQAITPYKALGIGGIYVAHLLENFFRPEMTMERVAGLGYFCIKYIEDYKLHSSVGIGDQEPQIHFIPDNERNTGEEKIDYEVNPETRPELFTRIKKDAIKRFNKNQKGMKNLFK
jgi:20S proteasome alpha/beta subunit